MAVRSIEDHVDTLLSRRIAEAKSQGAPSADVEAYAVFESILTTFLLKPRTVLYTALVSRNKLAQVISQELELVRDLKTIINDLGNPVYGINDPVALKKARTALLQIESLQKVSTESAAFSRLSGALDDFLKTQITPNVRRSDTDGLVRPASEASEDLPNTVAAVKALHAETLERLFSLSVGVENFLSAPIGSIIGTTTVARARDDIDEIISLVENGQAGASARDIAVRIIANRAAIRTLGSLPDPYGQLFGVGRTVPTYAQAEASGPFPVPASVELGALSSGPIPCELPSSATQLIIGKQVTFPVTVDGPLMFFLGPKEDEIEVRLSGTFATAQELCAAFVSEGSRVRAAPFMGKTNQIVINSDEPMHLMMAAGSLHDVLGLPLGTAQGLLLTTSQVAEALRAVFEDLISATRTSADTLLIRTMLPDVSLVLGVSWSATDWAAAWDLPSWLYPQTSELDVVDGSLPAVGDLISTPNGSSQVVSIVGTQVHLEEPVRQFSGEIKIVPAVVDRYQRLSVSVDSLVEQVVQAGYSENLAKLDAAVAPLRSLAAPAQRDAALEQATTLENLLQSMLDTLLEEATMLPTDGASEERKTLAGILETLAERRYDRAADLLIRCEFQEFTTLTANTASYGTNLLSTASAFAHADLTTPNRALDDGMDQDNSERS